MGGEFLLVGVDGGGTGCRARLCALDGTVLGEGRGGPANLRFGVPDALAAVVEAARGAAGAAGLGEAALERACAGLGLAGASEPALAQAARAHPLPFARAAIATDAAIAGLGAHGGGEGGLVIVGTGSIGWALVAGREHRVGGWGFPLSDEGSGAWIGAEAARRALRVHDGREPPSPLADAVLSRFDRDPHRVVAWMTGAKPRDFAALAPLVVEAAEAGDGTARAVMREAAAHVDALAARLLALGAGRIALAGGLSGPLGPWLGEATRARLVPARGDALDGAVGLARTLLPDRAAPAPR